ncbi:hypothetical protein BDV97DRAFT_228016 [Delphinella strobiligena]|nr:hypothetical protein BDV97DRAFT_228016 [Delphinella strobiligena]
MSVETDYEVSQRWFSRVAQSANGLAQDVLSLNGAYETTGDLATLRSAHKAGYQTQNGALSAERHPKLLSRRHGPNGNLRSSRGSMDYANVSELEDEMVDFFRQECSIQIGDASSSRSASPRSAWGSDENMATTGPDDIGHILPQTSQESAALASEFNGIMKPLGRLFVPEDQLYNANQDYPTAALREQIAVALSNREDGQCYSRWVEHSLASMSDANSTTHDSMSQPKESLVQQATKRLELISAHLAAPSRPLTQEYLDQTSRTLDYGQDSKTLYLPAITRDQDSPSQSERLYNHYCHGDCDPEWDSLGAHGPFCVKRELLQHGCQTPQRAHVFEPQRPVSQHLDLDQPQRSHLHQQPDIQAYEALEHMNQVPLQQSRGKEKAEFEFHCPWVGCGTHFQNGYQYQRDSDGHLRCLACVHEGCDEEFGASEESEWREHVLSPHHGLAKTPRCTSPVNGEAFEAAWEKGESLEKAWKSNEDFEKAWTEKLRD